MMRLCKNHSDAEKRSRRKPLVKMVGLVRRHEWTRGQGWFLFSSCQDLSLMIPGTQQTLRCLVKSRETSVSF